MGRFLSNTADPKKPETKIYFCYSYDAWIGGPTTREREWNHHMNWINSNVIGEPEATPYYTVEQLKDMGYVGIYAKD